MAEKWHPALETEGHQDAAPFDEKIVGQVGDQVRVLATHEVVPDTRRGLPRLDERLTARGRRRFQFRAEHPAHPTVAPVPPGPETPGARRNEVPKPTLQRRAPVATVAGEDFVTALPGQDHLD